MTERDYRLVREDGVASPTELQRAQDAMGRKHHEQDGAAETAVNALMFSLCQRGIAALSEPTTQRRLSELSKQQVSELIVRLDHLRPKYPKICDHLIVKVGGRL
jgi:hypothetical protein